MAQRLNEINYQQILLNKKYKLKQKELQRSKLMQYVIILSLVLTVMCLYKYAPKIKLPQWLDRSVIYESTGFLVVKVKNSCLDNRLYRYSRKGKTWV